MIRDLRKKFVLAAMAAFVATLAIVGVAINGGYFITDASHELKTPLAIISANTDLIEALSGDLGEAARADDEHGAETANGWKRTALERQNQPQVRTPQDDQDAQTFQDTQDLQTEQNGQSGQDGAPSELAPWIASARTRISLLDALVRDMVELSRADESRAPSTLRISGSPPCRSLPASGAWQQSQ